METRRTRKQPTIGGRLMWCLLAAIAIIVVALLFSYGARDPSKGPGNVPADGPATPLQQNGSPPTSK
jgi:hypothetical protein